MTKIDYKDLLEAGVHFGHLKRKWHPKMAPYVFMEKNGIHIIDLNKTVAKLEEATTAMKQIAKSGKKILFVATKKQAKDVVEKHVKPTGMPYVTARWPGGMLTNFATIRKAVKKMSSIDLMVKDGTFDVLSKRERLQIQRQRAKLERDLGSIADLNRLPSAIFIVDIMKEHIAVAEAKKLNIPTFAIVDTNSDPTKVDFPIPANDDAAKSIDKLMGIVCEGVTEGLEERQVERDKNKAAKAKAQDVQDAKDKEAKEAKEIKNKEAKEAKAKEAKAPKEEVKEEVKSKEAKASKEEDKAKETKAPKEEAKK